METPIVWVVQEGQNNYVAAEDYGAVRFITKGDIVKFEDSQRNREVEADIRDFLSKYIPEVDYLVPAGNPMLTAWLMLCLPRGKHKLLKWEGRRACYIPFTLEALK